MTTLATKRSGLIDKLHLNLAGEYRVCSELLKRGIFATVTYGNMKSCDVVAVGANRRAAIVEVKTSQSKKFVTGFYQKFKTPDQPHPTFWVLYSVKPDEKFFVLTHNELALVQAIRNFPGEDPLPPYETRVARVAKGVDNVVIENVCTWEGQWENIVRWCNEAP